MELHVRILDRIRAAMAAGHNAIPLGRAMGFHAIEVDEGRAIIELDTKDHHLNTMGRLHGGVLCTIADTAMGVAHACALPESATSATVEMKINFLRPAAAGMKLRADGKVIHMGRTVGVCECDITDEKGNLIAKSTGTFMSIPVGDAKFKS